MDSFVQDFYNQEIAPAEPVPLPEVAPAGKNRKQGKKLENIKELGQIEIPTPPNHIHFVSIVGQIEGHLTLPPQNKTTKYEHIIPQLIAVEQSSQIEGVLMVLNTVGGDVEAGLAIAEAISSITKPTVSLVLGGGHSIGVPVACSANYTFITESATMTVHPIRLTGLVIGVPQTLDYLDKMQDRVVNFIVSHSKCSQEAFRELMFRTGELTRDIGTVVLGSEAVKYGLIDEVGGVAQAVQKLEQMIEERKGGGKLH